MLEVENKEEPPTYTEVHARTMIYLFKLIFNVYILHYFGEVWEYNIMHISMHVRTCIDLPVMSLVLPSQCQGMAVIVSLVTNLDGRLNIERHRLLTLDREKEGERGV